MEFCEKCGGIIRVEANKAACASCGRKTKKKPKIEISEKAGQKGTIEVIKEEADNVYPIVEMDCPKCKNKKAYFWTLQTRASDEAETKFYKCTKCSNTWRKYR
jgi:DNA-directed RNA polymerase subunit M